MKKYLLLLLAIVTIGAFNVEAKRMSDLKIYINPGHGGYTGDDRPIHLYPFEQNDTAGYWESKSNLYKGLHMYHILDSLGATPYISRVKNTQADDRSLSGISAEANQLGVDLFFSIHSNAGENVNYPLMLYREQTIGTPRYPENITLSNILGEELYSNQLPVWTNPLQVAGDLTFYDNMWQGGLGVLRSLYVVGLLSEGGMHEHRPEAYRLMNDDYWWLEAWHFVHAIMKYFNTEDRFVTGNVAGIVYDDHNLREMDMPVTFHFFGRDKYAPINGCLVELLDAQGNVIQRRTTDNMYNGVFVFRNVAPGDYTLRTTHDKYYTEEKAVKVVADEVTYNDLPLSMRREFPLEIVSYTPQASEGETVSCATTLEFNFNTDVDEESFTNALKIEPAVDGYFTFTNNNHHASWTPTKSFEPNVTYNVTVDASASHPDRRYSQPGLTAPLTFSFTTTGRSRLELIDQFPAPDGEVHYANPTVEFRFDNQVDISGIYDLVSITDSKGNKLGVSKRNCKFNQLSNGYGNAIFSLSSNLTVGETYNVVLPAELRDREQLPMDHDVTFSFKAVDVTVDNGDAALINDFETEAPFAYNAESSTGVAAATPTCTKTNTYKFGGRASARFGYTFADSREGSIEWDYTGSPVVLNSDDELGMYVYGDFNNHDLYIGVTTGTDIKWLPVETLNFMGWRHATVSLSELDPSFTYLLSGFKLDQVHSLITQKGAFCIDDLTHKAGSGVANITVDEPDTEAVYYNLQGIEVANPSSGLYIERRGTTTRKVLLP